MGTMNIGDLDRVYRAICDVLDSKKISLLLDEPIRDVKGVPVFCPYGHMHPEDVGHVARWVVERLSA